MSSICTTDWDRCAVMVVDSMGGKYATSLGIFEDDKIFWTYNAVDGIDARAQFLELDSIVQGDQYAALRDVYLQRRNYEIAMRSGDDPSQGMFMEDDAFIDDEFIDDEAMPSDPLETDETLPTTNE